jgi:hypothetical protein
LGNTLWARIASASVENSLTAIPIFVSFRVYVYAILIGHHRVSATFGPCHFALFDYFGQFIDIDRAIATIDASDGVFAIVEGGTLFPRIAKENISDDILYTSVIFDQAFAFGAAHWMVPSFLW